jgi:hypothetical protein
VQLKGIIGETSVSAKDAGNEYQRLIDEKDNFYFKGDLLWEKYQ